MTQLRTWMDEQGLDVPTLAARVGVSENYIYQLRNGRPATDSVRYKFALVYGLETAAQLLGRTTEAVHEPA